MFWTSQKYCCYVVLIFGHKFSGHNIIVYLYLYSWSIWSVVVLKFSYAWLCQRLNFAKLGSDSLWRYLSRFHLVSIIYSLVDLFNSTVYCCLNLLVLSYVNQKSILYRGAWILAQESRWLTLCSATLLHMYSFSLRISLYMTLKSGQRSLQLLIFWFILTFQQVDEVQVIAEFIRAAKTLRSGNRSREWKKNEDNSGVVDQRRSSM